MNDKEFDRLLEQLPQVFDRNLADISFSEEMRRTVRGGAAAKELLDTKTKRGKRLFFQLVVVAIFLILGATSGLYLNSQSNKEVPYSPLFTPVETRVVDLDGKGTPEVVNTWKIKDGGQQDNLVALIWAQDREGYWKVVSSQTVEGGDFLPLEVISPSRQQGNLIVISTANRDNWISYRVLGYNGREVLPYLERSARVPEKFQMLLEEISALLPGGFER